MVNVYSFSEDLYKFSNSLKDYEGTSSNSFIDYPSPLYSNMENTFGIFGAYNKSSTTIIFDNELNDIIDELRNK